MRSVSDLLWLAGAKMAAQALPAVAAKPAGTDRPAPTEKTTFAEVGARIGEDNEVLRNLLIDTSHQLGAIDDLKETFSRLVEPLNNVLTTLEHERADNASSRGALAAIRTSHETLRTEFQVVEKKSAELQRDNDRLTRDLAASLQKGRELEDSNTKISSEISAVRVAMSVIVKQLGEETSNARSLSEEKGVLAARASNSDKQRIALETEVAHARERLSLLENDKEILQAALDKTLAESSRMSRHITENESALSEARNKIQQLEAHLAAAEAERNRTAAESSQSSRHLAEAEATLSEARSRLQQVEGNLAVAESERTKLAAACDEANERRQSEVYALGLKLDALRSRTDATEKLLASARQSLLDRTAEVRATEAKLLEATTARSEAEKKADHLSTVSQTLEMQTKALEQNGGDLAGRCKVLSETLTATDAALVHAQDKIKSLTAQIEQVQADAAAARTKAEEDFVQLTATIEHERCERVLAEGALETIRNDYARIQRQVAQERSLRRVDHQRRTIRPTP